MFLFWLWIVIAAISVLIGAVYFGAGDKRAATYELIECGACLVMAGIRYLHKVL